MMAPTGGYMFPTQSQYVAPYRPSSAPPAYYGTQNSSGMSSGMQTSGTSSGLTSGMSGVGVGLYGSSQTGSYLSSSQPPSGQPASGNVTPQPPAGLGTDSTTYQTPPPPRVTPPQDNITHQS